MALLITQSHPCEQGTGRSDLWAARVSKTLLSFLTACTKQVLSLRPGRHCHISGRVHADGLIGGDYCISTEQGIFRVRPLRWQCLTGRRDK